MERNPLNPWALDINGKFVSIEHAHKGESYTCPKCHEPLSYQREGKGEKRTVRPFFKHHPDSSCSGYTPHESESAIHKFAKQAVYEILREFIDKHNDFKISWMCPDCHKEMTANLLKRAKDVQMEEVLDAARPDVALLDEKGNTIVAIEIVFSHDVETETMRFYDNNNIVLVRIKVYSAEDCNNMVHKLHFPDSINLCFNDSCPRGEKMQVYRKIIPVVDSNRIVGLAVALDNPFEEEIIKGLPFNEQDKRTAIAIAKEKWPSHQLHFSDDPAFPYALLKPIQQISFQRKMQYRPNPYHTGIEEIQHQRQVKAIRANYARISRAKKATKKSGGKRGR